MEETSKSFGSKTLQTFKRVGKALVHPGVIWTAGVNRMNAVAPASVLFANGLQFVVALAASLANEFGAEGFKKAQKVKEILTEKISPHLTNAAFNGANHLVGLAQYAGALGGDITPANARDKAIYGALACICYTCMWAKDNKRVSAWLGRQKKALRTLAHPSLWLAPQIPAFYGACLTKLSATTGAVTVAGAKLPIVDSILYLAMGGLIIDTVLNGEKEGRKGFIGRNSAMLAHMIAGGTVIAQDIAKGWPTGSAQESNMHKANVLFQIGNASYLIFDALKKRREHQNNLGNPTPMETPEISR